MNIIELAKEADADCDYRGVVWEDNGTWRPKENGFTPEETYWEFDTPRLERFAAIVRAEALEEVAKELELNNEADSQAIATIRGMK